MPRPAGSQNKDKPWCDALRMQLAAAGGDQKALRAIADTMIALAQTGDMQAIKEIGDRLDGKVAQAIVGDDEHDPIGLALIERIIKHPTDTNS